MLIALLWSLISIYDKYDDSFVSGSDLIAAMFWVNNSIACMHALVKKECTV